MNHLLLVEDDVMLSKKLTEFLSSEGFNVSTAFNCSQAQTSFTKSIDLALIDWTLPDGEGIELLKQWKATRPEVPMIMLTARATTGDKIMGLGLGSNDYVTKPFDPLELVARVRSHIKQAKSITTLRSIESEYIRSAGIEIHLPSRRVTYSGAEVDLTRKQFELLKLLVTNSNRVFSRDELLTKIWGYDCYPTTRTVDNHVAQLRHKLHPEFFETLHGVGYRYREML